MLPHPLLDKSTRKRTHPPCRTLPRPNSRTRALILYCAAQKSLPFLQESCCNMVRRRCCWEMFIARASSKLISWSTWEWYRHWAADYHKQLRMNWRLFMNSVFVTIRLDRRLCRTIKRISTLLGEHRASLEPATRGGWLNFWFRKKGSGLDDQSSQIHIVITRSWTGIWNLWSQTHWFQTVCWSEWRYEEEKIGPICKSIRNHVSAMSMLPQACI